MIISKKRILFVVFVLSILFLNTGSVYAEYYSKSTSCINGCCTSSSEYSEKPYVPEWYMNPSLPMWGQFPGWTGEPYPTASIPGYCIPYRQGTVGDYLCAGQYHTYCFATSGKRTYMEWILDGGCIPGMATVLGLYPQYVTDWRKQECTADFDLYVYQNQEPDPSVAPGISDTTKGSNAYAGWYNPCENCYYCVVVYCKQGCGYYYLTTNSYRDLCLFGGGYTGSDEGSQVMYTGSDEGSQVMYTGSDEGSQVMYTGADAQTAPGDGQAGTGIPYQGSQASSTQGMVPSGQGSQAAAGGNQPGHATQTGTGGQEPYYPSPAGSSPGPEPTGDELSTAEQPWTTPYYEKAETGMPDNLTPDEQPWGAQYPMMLETDKLPSIPVPSLTGDKTGELKPDEEAWSARYPMTYTTGGEDTFVPEEASVPNVTWLTPSVNITNVTEEQPGEDVNQDLYYAPVPLDMKQTGDIKYW